MKRLRGQTPVVNHANFTDARPTLGSSSASFDPGRASQPLQGGPPRYVGVKGKRAQSKGLTNKRITDNI